jgi:hypothetical protein
MMGGAGEAGLGTKVSKGRAHHNIKGGRATEHHGCVSLCTAHCLF